MPEGVSGREFAALLVDSVQEYKIPYVETFAEYHCLFVRRLRRLDGDVWIVTDGSHWWNWEREVWTMDQRWSSLEAQFGRPLQEAWALAEVKAAERRQQYEDFVARKEAELAEGDA